MIAVNKISTCGVAVISTLLPCLMLRSVALCCAVVLCYPMLPYANILKSCRRPVVSLLYATKSYRVILVPRAHDPSGLWQGSRALAGPNFLSMRRVFVSNSQPIRFARFDNKSVNRGLPVLDQTRALDPCHRPEGSWALGTRMVPCKSTFAAPNLCWACVLASRHIPTGGQVVQIAFGQISPSASSTRDLGTRLNLGMIICR